MQQSANEEILIEWQDPMGNWKYGSKAPNSTAVRLKHYMDLVRNSVRGVGNGRVRAIGEQTGQIYDIQ